MSFKVVLPTPVSITNPVSKDILTTTVLPVTKIIDSPGKQEVAVVINGVGTHVVQALTGANYTAQDWNKNTLSAALIAQRWS